MDLGGDATGYRECGEDSGPTCPQSGARHWKAVRKIIAYLKAPKDLGVVFQRGGDLKMSLFADADYADRCNDRRSVLGVAVMLRNTAVSASNTTQHCVILSAS